MHTASHKSITHPDDFTLNPHFLYTGGVVTLLPASLTQTPADCTSTTINGGDVYQGRTGIFLTAPRIPVGRFHRFRVKDDTDPKRAAFNFTSEATTLIGCVTGMFYPERPFNQGETDRVFVFAGSTPTGTPACFSPPLFRSIRACQTTYGWHIQVDSSGNGTFDMDISFIFG
jgi:hypothetical protein